MPTRPKYGEGRRAVGERIDQGPPLSTGVMGAACVQGEVRNTGDLEACSENTHGWQGAWRNQESEGPIVPMKRSNSRGGTGPWFRALCEEWTRRRLA
jgi:hypothetical protein